MSGIALHINTDDMIAQAKRLGAVEDQLPYIMARTLNDAAEATRSFMISSVWPSSVTMRNRSFMQAALTTKDSRAQKGDLTVEIYDKLGRANLKLHAEGGTRVGHGGNIAIGSRNVTRGSRGVPKSQRPRALKNAFKKGDVILQRQGPKGASRLRLMYVLRPTAQIKKDVPFYQAFRDHMLSGVANALPRNVALAMKTRR